MLFELIESLPTEGLYAIVVLFILLSFEVGFRIGTSVKLDDDEDGSASLGPMVGSLLGMLAFVLAFTFSMAASNHNQRKQAVLDEANVISTAYLRADLLTAPYKEKLKGSLREYVDVRLDGVEKKKRAVAIEQSIELHKLMWNDVARSALEHPSSNSSLVIRSVNEVIDMHEERVTVGVRNRIPHTIWIALFVIAVLSMITLGVQAGLSHKRRLVAVIPLILAFSALATVVVDLDRSQNGTITVNQAAMKTLQESMKVDVP